MEGREDDAEVSQSLFIISFSLPPILLFPHLSLSQMKFFVASWKNRDPWCIDGEGGGPSEAGPMERLFSSG